MEELNIEFNIDCGDIYLRELRLEDLDEYYEITTHPGVEEFLPDWKSTKEQRLDWLVNWEIPGGKEFLHSVPDIGTKSLKLGIILKETEEFIGCIATSMKDELPAPNREISYVISEYYRNKGYTTNAVKGLAKYLFEKTNLEILNAIALTNNESSNRVITKSGFTYMKTIDIEGEEYYQYILNKKHIK
ncbi:GNAT family N-acetyltransferase [Bacillus sp. SCS-151]|uniref:GNAT family N-acetyltransferase n=1 Tax=Nanhaiella sioensis TaxID=3115293 RepID=UPI00397B939C